MAYRECSVCKELYDIMASANIQVVVEVNTNIDIFYCCPVCNSSHKVPNKTLECLELNLI